MNIAAWFARRQLRLDVRTVRLPALIAAKDYSPEREPFYVGLVSANPPKKNDDPPIDWKEYDTPSALRPTQRFLERLAQRHAEPFSILDIPAFLRRQAD
jgi:hypothetical protein